MLILSALGKVGIVGPISEMSKLRHRGINEVTKVNEKLLCEHIYWNFVNFVVKGINYLDCGQKNSISILLKRKQN